MEPFGLLSLVKPPGMTSHDVVSVVRRALGTRRVGHGGTLDPAAAGVMTVAVGKATRLLGYLRDDKAYWAEIVLGVRTDTLDVEGAIVEEADASALGEVAFASALAGFSGRIVQVPPLTSAVQVGGKRLYELARAGRTEADVEIPTREVTIHRLRLAEFVPGARAIARVEVACSAGTYIRSLARDVGAALGLPASLGFLLRTAAGDCVLERSQTLEELAAGPRFLDEERWLGHLPAAALDAAGVAEIGFGRRVPAQPGAEGVWRLHGPEGRLIGLGRVVEGQLQPVFVI